MSGSNLRGQNKNDLQLCTKGLVLCGILLGISQKQAIPISSRPLLIHQSPRGSPRVPLFAPQVRLSCCKLLAPICKIILPYRIRARHVYSSSIFANLMSQANLDQDFKCCWRPPTFRWPQPTEGGKVTFRRLKASEGTLSPAAVETVSNFRL